MLKCYGKTRSCRTYASSPTVPELLHQVGTPITVPSQGGVDLGRIASMELNHKAVDTARRGESVAMKLEPTNMTEGSRLYGRHFDFKASPFSQADLCTVS